MEDPFGFDSWFQAAALKNIRQLTPVVRQHLARVYRTVFYATISALLGCYLQHQSPSLVPFSPWVGGAFGFLALMGVGSRQFSIVTRYRLLMFFAALEGFSIGPLIDLALGMGDGLVMQALVATAVVFACFSLAALYAKRRSYLYLGAWLSSALSMLVLLSLGGLLFGVGDWNASLQLYGGLLLFAGFVIFDTQLIVERASRGDLDYVGHSLNLWMDLFAIFVRIIIVLFRSQHSRSERRKRSPNRFGTS